MKTGTRCLVIGLVAFGILGWSSAAQAQRGVGHVSGPVSARAFPRSGAVSTARRRPANIANGSFGATGSFGNFGLSPSTGFSQGLFNSVPPFGYGFGNLGTSNLGVMAQIDPATRANLALALRIARVTPTVGYFPFFADSYPEAFVPGTADSQEPGQQPQQQPQIIVVQAPPAGGAQAQQQSEQAPPQQPLPDVGSFILVMRNGSQISAVAFTRQDDRIVYVGSDGSRRSVALSDVDAAATERINDEKGTPLHLPLS